MSLCTIIDSHAHSTFSPDSAIDLRVGIEQTIKNGLGGIVFTDHLDPQHPKPKYDKGFDFAARGKILEALREEFSSKIKVLEGLEFGVQPQVVNEAKKLVASYDFDFVICSTHVVDGIDIAHKEFFEGKSKSEAYAKYLEAIYQTITSFSNFDVVGHIGYICRHAPYADVKLNYVDHRDMFDAIFKTLIDQNKGIELNTAGIFRGLGFMHPALDSLKRYKELGGEIITIGSDAHQPERIGADFELACKFLLEAGFKYVTYFENRRPAFVKI